MAGEERLNYFYVTGDCLLVVGRLGYDIGCGFILMSYCFILMLYCFTLMP